MLIVSQRYRLAQWLTGAVPSAASFWLAERLADAYWRASRRDRAAVRANLAAVFGTPLTADSELVRDVFRSFAVYLVEFINAHRLKRAGIDVAGVEETRRAIGSGRGGILLTAHIGNWELGAIVLRQAGLAVSAVVLPHRDPCVNRFFDQQRTRCGVDVIPLNREATGRCVQRIREGGWVGLVADREFGRNGLPACLGNRPTLVPRGPALLSLRTGCPVVPVFLIRERWGRLRFYSEPPIWPQADGDMAMRVAEFTRAYVAVVERYVKRFPSQWIMF